MRLSKVQTRLHLFQRVANLVTSYWVPGISFAYISAIDVGVSFPCDCP